MHPPLTIKDVVRAIKPLARIPRPDGDNEGDCINSDSIMRALSQKHREQVIRAEEVLHEYTRQLDGQPNRRAVNTLTRNGFSSFLNEDQYEPDRIVGRTTVEDWEIDISDPSNEPDDD
ncbi:hypothetical protein GJ697_04130 [Pseudoduganella sp. FT25W]|uniref:Uncharacterized protein n=1 Tax=Duganella alba TaxID=2666081 RepID=A0A6L5QBI3_9BURK|nr:hypothetical protein [Duganella alba]MRX07019.1 hypothetical protein [Duganella alba]MRX16084.1 hypothetical protein [Duganella alba]